jgi:hypothetical protein
LDINSLSFHPHSPANSASESDKSAEIEALKTRPGITYINGKALIPSRPPRISRDFDLMDFTVKLLSQLFLGTSILSSNSGALNANCLSLKSRLDLENTTILDVSYLPAKAKVTPLGTCTETAIESTSTPLCRVQFFTNTSDSSVVHAELWLPDEWYGRFLGIGNGGLDGCASFIVHLCR